MSTQRIISNHNNILLGATITASDVAGSAQVYLTESDRRGNGGVALTGEYTGLEDARYEIEIMSTAGGGSVSTPIFRGMGSGSVSDVDAGTLPAQGMTITLADMGIPTAVAEVDFYGVTLRAKVAGNVGNGITIAVDDSGVVSTKTTLVLFEAIAANTDTLIGPQFDFGAVSLATGGTLPADAPRIRFNGDPQIFRQYKRYSNNQWEYHLVPAPPRAIAKGTPVFSVTGSYTVTVSAGAVVEQYTVTTLYDLLLALGSSDLIEVAGAVVKDLSPGGMATLDIPLKTAAYHLAVNCSNESAPALEGITIKNIAPTEIIELSCIDNSVIGAEVWSVKGSATGTMAQARTGIDYTVAASPVGFTIPKWLPDLQVSAVAGPAVTLSSVDYTSRGDDEFAPEILIRGGQVGIAGKAGSITAVFTKFRRTPECDARDAVLSGFISPACLGLDITTITGGNSVDPTLKTKLIELYTYREEFIRANTETVSGTITTGTTTVPDPNNPALYRAVGNIDVITEYVMTIPSKSFNSSTSAWDYLNNFGNWYQRGGNEYIQNQFDGDVTFANDIYTATGTRIFTPGIWTTPDFLVEISINGFATASECAEFTESILNNPNINRTSPDSNFSLPKIYGGGTIQQFITHTTKTPRGAVKDIAWMDTALTILEETLNVVYVDATALAAWDALKTEIFTDLAALKTSSTNDLALTDAIYMERYRATVNNILLSLGIVPKKTDGSAVGTGCWTEKEEDYWAIDGYAPAYTNTAYISTKFSSDGAPYSTREFGFFIACKCTQHLKYGDSVTIAINGGSSAAKTYQAGDTFSIPVVSATPLALSGGQDGDDTVTWQIKGMVSGALPDYQVVRDIPARYHDPATGFGFDLSIGGIPFALGDSFSLAIEGGSFKWRKDDGNFSINLPITDTVIDAGLNVVFTPGASPSFAIGDNFKFLAKQPGAPSQVVTPDSAGWLFLQDGASFTATFAPAAIDAFALAWPGGTPSLLEYSSNGVDGWVNLPPMVAGKGVYTLLLSEPVVAGGIRLTMSADGGGSVGWFFAGQTLATEDAPDTVTMRRVFDLVHGDKDQAALSVGSAWAGEVSWKHLPVADFNRHLTAIEYAKTTNNAPVIFIPHHQHVDEAVLVKIEADSFDITDMFQYHPNAVEHRKLSLTIPFGPVYR